MPTNINDEFKTSNGFAKDLKNVKYEAAILTPNASLIGKHFAIFVFSGTIAGIFFHDALPDKPCPAKNKG
jgi:hypothetical protein